MQIAWTFYFYVIEFVAMSYAEIKKEYIDIDDEQESSRCSIKLLNLCECGINGTLQNVYVESCPIIDEDGETFDCQPCPNACSKFSNCETCSMNQCRSCPPNREGQFCDILDAAFEFSIMIPMDSFHINLSQMISMPKPPAPKEDKQKFDYLFYRLSSDSFKEEDKNDFDSSLFKANLSTDSYLTKMSRAKPTIINSKLFLNKSQNQQVVDQQSLTHAYDIYDKNAESFYEVFSLYRNDSLYNLFLNGDKQIRNSLVDESQILNKFHTSNKFKDNNMKQSFQSNNINNNIKDFKNYDGVIQSNDNFNFETNKYAESVYPRNKTFESLSKIVKPLNNEQNNFSAMSNNGESIIFPTRFINNDDTVYVSNTVKSVNNDWYLNLNNNNATSQNAVTMSEQLRNNPSSGFMSTIKPSKKSHVVSSHRNLFNNGDSEHDYEIIRKESISKSRKGGKEIVLHFGRPKALIKLAKNKHALQKNMKRMKKLSVAQQTSKIHEDTIANAQYSQLQNISNSVIIQKIITAVSNTDAKNLNFENLDEYGKIYPNKNEELNHDQDIFVVEKIHNRVRREEEEKWCPMVFQALYGNLECRIWSYQKLCQLQCHDGYENNQTAFQCIRTLNVWMPPIRPCTGMKNKVKETAYRNTDYPNATINILEMVLLNENSREFLNETANTTRMNSTHQETAMYDEEMVFIPRIGDINDNDLDYKIEYYQEYMNALRNFSSDYDFIM